MKAERGFTLIEMIMALGLSSAALVGVMSLFLPIISGHANGLRNLTTQADALLAHKSLNRTIAEASEVYWPARGAEGDVLSGCANFDSAKGGGTSALIDPTTPGVSFYYCVTGGSLYLHSAALMECPPAEPERCGLDGATMLARGVSHSPGHAGYFVRSSGSPNVVEVHFQSSSKGVSQVIDTAISYQGSR